MTGTTSPWDCPYCGAAVSPNASGCRGCGANKVDGRWMNPESCDGLDLPDDDDFNYDDFVRQEFGDGNTRKSPREVFWWCVAVILLIAFAGLALGGFF